METFSALPLPAAEGECISKVLPWEDSISDTFEFRVHPPRYSGPVLPLMFAPTGNLQDQLFQTPKSIKAIVPRDVHFVGRLGRVEGVLARREKKSSSAAVASRGERFNEVFFSSFRYRYLIF